MESTFPDGRLTAFGNQLIDVHLWLRQELARLRTDFGSFVDGGERLRTLQAHCLTFCSAVARHHTGEDEGAFPALAEAFPELRPLLEELRKDHRVVAETMARLEELVGGLGPDTDSGRARDVRGELDGLAAVLESHFVYEERRIVSALNALSVPAWQGTRPGFLLTGSEGTTATET
ncbi:hemerythrin domain-containing protein [Microbispora sp. NPDC049125]|uniref:hemerythrin domain-containing protein n=1 Tax=Microbispora sp. NPDC049125 TaxID=3154929 RepID=UPI003467896B